MRKRRMMRKTKRKSYSKMRRKGSKPLRGYAVSRGGIRL